MICVPRPPGRPLRLRGRSIPVSRSFRRTCALLAPAAVLLSLCIPAAASAAPGDLPDLVQSRPGNVVGGYFDDHSISGDNHLGWSYGASQSEPLAIELLQRDTQPGHRRLELCGFQEADGRAGARVPGRAGMLRQQAARRAAAPVASGWSSRTSRRTTRRRTRSTLALSGPGPLHASCRCLRRWAGNSAARDRMGHVLGHLSRPRRPLAVTCSNDPLRPSLPTQRRVGPGQGPRRTAPPDDPAHRDPTDFRADRSATVRTRMVRDLPTRRPFIAEAGTTAAACACTQVPARQRPSVHRLTATPVAAAPATCYVPRGSPAALTGPGGRDPMAAQARRRHPARRRGPARHCSATVPIGGATPRRILQHERDTAATIVTTDRPPVPQAPTTARTRHRLRRRRSRRARPAG